MHRDLLKKTRRGVQRFAYSASLQDGQRVLGSNTRWTARTQRRSAGSGHECGHGFMLGVQWKHISERLAILVMHRRVLRVMSAQQGESGGCRTS